MGANGNLPPEVRELPADPHRQSGRTTALLRYAIERARDAHESVVFVVHNQTMAEYASRLAAKLDPGITAGSARANLFDYTWASGGSLRVMSQARVEMAATFGQSYDLAVLDHMVTKSLAIKGRFKKVVRGSLFIPPSPDVQSEPATAEQADEAIARLLVPAPKPEK